MGEWVKETPKAEGWYWIKYNVGRKYRICPCELFIFKKEKKGATNFIRTAGNVSFVEGPNHGGKGLKASGESKIDKSIRFWSEPLIEPVFKEKRVRK